MSAYGSQEYESEKNIKQDIKNERIMDTFLVQKVYPEFIKAGIVKNITTVSDVDLQEKGVDAIWELEDGTEVYVDNKTRVSTLNIKSNAVPFEVSTNKNDGTDRKYGWLTCLSNEIVDEVNLTDYIMFIHPYSKNKKERNFNNVALYDIEEIDILLVRVDEVFKYFKEYYKLDYKKIYDKATEFDNSFIKKTEGMDFIPNELRKCIEGFEKGAHSLVNWSGETYTIYDAVIHTSINSYMPEDPTNLLIMEDVCKTFSHTRHFHYHFKKGLSEYFDVYERREFSKKLT